MGVATRPLTIWAVSDGRAGMENQALGLAEAVAARVPAMVKCKRVRWRAGFDRLPSAMKTPAMLDPASDAVTPAEGEAWPDLWIATGRATLPLSAKVRERSGGRTFVVQTQDPRWRTGAFDLVVAPRHDEVTGPNVLSILGSPHRVTPHGVEAARRDFPALDALPRPRVAVLIGGRSRAHDLPEGHAAELAEAIEAAIRATDGSLMLTFSRRTPEAARAVMTARLSDLPGVIWDGDPPNPYFAFLSAADHVLVTEDSANMAAEAASTGKPVHILPMVPLKAAGKFARLQSGLREHGAARLFDGSLESWSYEPLDETGRAADEILRRMGRAA